MLYGGIEVDGEIFQYHAGSDDEHCSGIPTMKRIFRTAQCVDGFVSANFCSQGGRLTTPVVSTEGNELMLNVDAGSGIGNLVILDEVGNSVEGFGLDDCDDISVDKVSHKVRWGGKSPREILGTPVSLQFEMRNARLFAFQLSEE